LNFKCKIHTIPILTIYVSSVRLRLKKLEIRNIMTVKSRGENQRECRRMELNSLKDRAIHGGDNLLFWNVLIFSWLLNSYPYFQACTEVHSFWAVATQGDLQSTSRGLDPWVKCKINMIPILMHQMRILSTRVSLVMLRPHILEIRNVMTVLWLSKIHFTVGVLTDN
jgi:hypothetical protein